VSRASASDSDSRKLSALCGPIVLATFGLVYGLQSHIDDTYGEYRATEEILYVESGEILKRITVGFENVAADLYWLRTVQYFGGKRQDVTNKDYRLLAPLLDVTTDLDPDLKIAYTYGATFLSEPFPMGAGLPLKAIELVDKGIENHPEYWRFYLDKGFIYFNHLQDYERAAEIFLAGSELPGAPYWMVATASRTLTRGGRRDVARSLWSYLYESAETDQQRDNALIHLKQLDAIDQIELLEKIVAQFQTEVGRLPASWDEMIQARYLNRIPVDPTGAPYGLVSETGEVGLTPETDLGILPIY
jgi:tetratricopeptide (TPR) repeat protein